MRVKWVVLQRVLGDRGIFRAKNHVQRWYIAISSADLRLNLLTGVRLELLICLFKTIGAGRKLCLCGLYFRPQLSSSAPGIKQTDEQFKPVSRLSRRSAGEMAMYHLSPSNRSAGWPGPARLKLYTPYIVQDVQCWAVHKGQSPAPVRSLRHKSESF